MRIAVWSALAVAGCGVAAEEAETVLTVPTENGQYTLQIAIDGDDLWLFQRHLQIVSLADGSSRVVGEIVPNGGLIGTVAVSNGHGYWMDGLTDIGHVDPDGNVTRLSAGTAPRRLQANGGCGYYADVRSLMRWCPEDAAPVEVMQDGPGGSFHVDDDAFYWWENERLLRVDRETGVRSALVTGPGALGWQIVTDADAVYWLEDTILRMVPHGGGTPVDLGTLAVTDAQPRLLVDAEGFYVGTLRLRRGETTATDWLPTDVRCGSFVIAGGYSYWVCHGTREPIEAGSVVYRAVTDGPPVVVPGIENAGGELGYLRPPFL